MKETISPLVMEVFNDRRESIREFQETDGPPLDYWPTVDKCSINYFVVAVNDLDMIAQVRVSIKHFHYREVLNFDADRTAFLKVYRDNNETEIMEVRDSGVLSLLASTYEALSRDLIDPEWDIRLKVSRRSINMERAKI